MALPGTNVLAVRARDRGGESYLDIQTTAADVHISSVDFASTIVKIYDGSTPIPIDVSTEYTANLINNTGSTLGVSPADPVVLQSWIDQGANFRAAGGTQVTCTETLGELPATCAVPFSMFARSVPPIVGSGTLVPGPATARFELKQGSTVFHTFTVPITLVAYSPPPE
jgi:hypothetical protein